MVSDLVGDIAHESRKIGIKVPSRKAIAQLLAAKDPAQIMSDREGAKAAADKFRRLD